MGIINRWLLTIILAFSVLIVTFVVGFEMIIFNDAYFRWHYENREIEAVTGMSVDELMYVTDEMLDYLRGDRATLDMKAMIDGENQEVFGEREKSHMVDVRDLYLNVRWIRRIAMITIALIILIGVFLDRKMLDFAFRRMKYVIGILLVFVIAMAVLFALDFERYFVLFHQIFFSNELWLLNPRTDILINMVPESYFYSIVMIGVLVFIVLLSLSISIVEVVRKRLEKR